MSIAKGKNLRELTQGSDLAPADGGSCPGVVALLIMFLPLIIISAITPFLSALLLKKYLKTIEIEHKILSFRATFKILFKISVIYQIIFSIVIFCVIMVFTLFPTSITANDNNDIQIVLGIVVGLYFAIQIPSILITANFLQKKLAFFTKFNGFSGYLRSVVFIAFAMAVIPLLFILAALYTTNIYLFPRLKFFLSRS